MSGATTTHTRGRPCGGLFRTACGKMNHGHLPISSDPEKVTCKKCAKSLNVRQRRLQLGAG